MHEPAFTYTTYLYSRKDIDLSAQTSACSTVLHHCLPASQKKKKSRP